VIPLDEDRAASMADEGGVSAAVVETQSEPRVDGHVRRRSARVPPWAVGATLGFLAGVSFYAFKRSR
jgi:hypothetical protein